MVCGLLGTLGCSAIIASSGVSDLDFGAVMKPGASRQDIEEVIGSADSVEARSDGVRVAAYRVRQPVEGFWHASDFKWSTRPFIFEQQGAGVGVLVPFIEIYATVEVAVRSARNMRDLRVVYGADDRLLFFYDAGASAPERFLLASRALGPRHWEQLSAGGCPSWVSCLAVYGEDLRKWAAWVDYRLSSADEKHLAELLTVAKDKDEGRTDAGPGLIRVAGGMHAASAFNSPRAFMREVFLDQLTKGDRCPQWVPCAQVYVEMLRWREELDAEPVSPAGATERLMEAARTRDQLRDRQDDCLRTIDECAFAATWSLTTLCSPK